MQNIIRIYGGKMGNFKITVTDKESGFNLDEDLFLLGSDSRIYIKDIDKNGSIKLNEINRDLYNIKVECTIDDTKRGIEDFKVSFILNKTGESLDAVDVEFTPNDIQYIRKN